MAQAGARIHRDPRPRLDPELRTRSKSRAGAIAGFAIATLTIVEAAAGAAGKVTAAAIWQPAPSFMTGFHRACDGAGGGAFDTCFVGAMAKAGASPAALDFTRQLGDEAYLQALSETPGPVAVAHVFYPFRANENDAWLLVNGSPDLIDVDDEHRLALDAMWAAPAYRGIRRRFPEVSFWPGDRGTAGPAVAEGGREFVVGYLLRNLCHACAVVGHVRYAFDFGATGRFLGTRLVSIIPASE